MAEPSPTDPPAGPEPPAGEGLKPDPGVTPPEPGQEPAGRTYTEPYVKQLRKENADSRTRIADLETRLQEHEDEKKSELEKATDKATQADKRATSAETKLLRYEVAADRGLSMEAAGFLTGTTREEIELRADELAKLLKQGKPAAGYDGGARPPAPPEGKDPEQEHNALLLRAFGRQSPP